MGDQEALHPDRMTAAIAGAKRYQAAPCGRGHDGQRYTSNGCCVQCCIASATARRDKFRRILTENAV